MTKTAMKHKVEGSIGTVTQVACTGEGATESTQEQPQLEGI